MKHGLEGDGAGTLTSHCAILSFVQDSDLVCLVRRLALGQATIIWSAVIHPDLFHQHRDLAWFGADEVLPVWAVMYARRLATVAVCPREGCCQEETVHHGGRARTRPVGMD